MYTVGDVLAYVGGSAGLFTGFSMLSAVELLVVIVCTVWELGKRCCSLNVAHRNHNGKRRQKTVSTGVVIYLEKYHANKVVPNNPKEQVQASEPEMEARTVQENPSFIMEL